MLRSMVKEGHRRNTKKSLPTLPSFIEIEARRRRKFCAPIAAQAVFLQNRRNCVAKDVNFCFHTRQCHSSQVQFGPYMNCRPIQSSMPIMSTGLFRPTSNQSEANGYPLHAGLGVIPIPKPLPAKYGWSATSIEVTAPAGKCRRNDSVCQPTRSVAACCRNRDV